MIRFGRNSKIVTSIERLNPVNIAIGVIITQLTAHLSINGFGRVNYQNLVDYIYTFIIRNSSRLILENSRNRITFYKIARKNRNRLIDLIMVKASKMGVNFHFDTTILSSIIEKAEKVALTGRHEPTSLIEIKYGVKDRILIFNLKKLIHFGLKTT
jgi:hypothetical protein